MKKVVLKLDLMEDKTKQKVMKNVSSLSGIESIAMDMKDKKLTVTGDVDPVTIVSKLRKICHTEIVSVGPAKEEKKDAGADKKKEEEKKKAEEKKKEEEKKKAEEARKLAYEAYLKNLNNLNQQHAHTHTYPPYYQQQQPQQQYYPQYNHPPTPYYTKVVHDETPNCVIS